MTIRNLAITRTTTQDDFDFWYWLINISDIPVRDMRLLIENYLKVSIDRKTSNFYNAFTETYNPDDDTIEVSLKDKSLNRMNLAFKKDKNGDVWFKVG